MAVQRITRDRQSSHGGLKIPRSVGTANGKDPFMRFHNLAGDARIAGVKDVLRWQLGLHNETQPKTPRTGVSVPTVSNDGKALIGALRDGLTWIGHASYLVQLGGVNALVDPVYSRSLGPGLSRNVAPGLDFALLPKIDAVLITHNHRDHMDEPTLKKLGPDPVYFVPKGLKKWCEARKLNRVIEMDWWQTEAIGPLNVTFVPSQHWSRRWLHDTNDSWWGGYVLESGGVRVYHSGDTAWFDGFSLIRERVGPIHAAMLPIGAYAPRWFMRHQHMNPEDAVRAFQALGAEKFVAMHWGTFKLTDEPLTEPPEFLRSVWEETNLSESRCSIPAIGETIWIA